MTICPLFGKKGGDDKGLRVYDYIYTIFGLEASHAKLI